MGLADATLPGNGSLEGRRRLGGAFAIAIDRIRPDPDQPRRRLDTAAQQELDRSVKRLGILQPITVRFVEAEQAYRIITGERRYHAAREAGLAEVPCWVQSPREEEVLLHQIVENWQRLDMHPYDLADAQARLRDANRFSQKELARETGKPESEVSRLLSLLTLEPTVQEAARANRDGSLTRRHLFAIAQVPSSKQPGLLRTIQEERLTATQTERIVREQKAKATGRKTRGAPVARQVRYITSIATVTLAFRRKEVGPPEVLTALDEVRSQVEATAHQQSSHGSDA